MSRRESPGGGGDSDRAVAVCEDEGGGDAGFGRDGFRRGEFGVGEFEGDGQGGVGDQGAGLVNDFGPHEERVLGGSRNRLAGEIGREPDFCRLAGGFDGVFGDFHPVAVGNGLERAGFEGNLERKRGVLETAAVAAVPAAEPRSL